MNILKKENSIKFQINSQELLKLKESIDYLLTLNDNILDKINNSNKKDVFMSEYSDINTIHSKSTFVKGKYNNIIFELVGKNNG